MILKKIPSNTCLLQRYCRERFPDNVCIVFHRNSIEVLTYAILVNTVAEANSIVEQIKEKKHKTKELTKIVNTIKLDLIKSIQILEPVEK